MKFVKPTLFQDAITKLGRRQVIVSGLDSEAWSRVPVALRERAFFSSRIENARFLQRSKDLLTDWLAGARESVTLTDGTVTTALKTGSRAQFIEQARQFALSEGMGPIDPRDKGGLKDITSAKRLGLIFDTQTRAAHDFGNWLQGQDPDLLAEFPASRFIREREVKEPRDTHWMHENEVRLKTDLEFWTALNRDFGVPWGPWGWGCGHAVEDVDRSEADRLGLLAPGQAVIPAIQDFNTRLQASASNLEQETLDWLEDSFGDQVKIDRAAGTIRWAGQFGRTAPAVSTPVPGKRDTLDALVAEKEALKAELEALRLADNPNFWTDRDTILARIGALTERARVAIEVPAAERAAVGIDRPPRSRASRVLKTAEAGGAIVSRYTASELIKRLAPIKVRAVRRRAFYRQGEIHIRPGDDLVAAHEIMHGVEIQNTEILKRSAEFLFRRGAGETPRPLSELTGHRGYGPREIAFDDKWRERGGTPYSGKVYSYKGAGARSTDLIATEVLTTGIERLHTDPLEFYTADREYFEFVLNTLRNR